MLHAATRRIILLTLKQPPKFPEAHHAQTSYQVSTHEPAASKAARLSLGLFRWSVGTISISITAGSGWPGCCASVCWPETSQHFIILTLLTFFSVYHCRQSRVLYPFSTQRYTESSAPEDNSVLRTVQMAGLSLGNNTSGRSLLWLLPSGHMAAHFMKPVLGFCHSAVSSSRRQQLMAERSYVKNWTGHLSTCRLRIEKKVRILNVIHTRPASCRGLQTDWRRREDFTNFVYFKVRHRKPIIRNIKSTKRQRNDPKRRQRQLTISQICHFQPGPIN